MHRSDLRKVIAGQLIAFRAPVQIVHQQLPNDFNTAAETRVVDASGVQVKVIVTQVASDVSS